MRMPDLRRRQVWPDRRGRARGARIRSLPLQARRARAAEDGLPGVRDRRPGADADAADREGAFGPGAARPCRRVEVLRSSAAASSGRHLHIYARSGVEIDRSVMAGWIGRLAGLLEPLSERIERHVRAGLALHADDTPVPVLDPGKGKTKTGRLWTVVRDERPFGATPPPA